jgi:hypothetical protein
MSFAAILEWTTQKWERKNCWKRHPPASYILYLFFLAQFFNLRNFQLFLCKFTWFFEQNKIGCVLYFSIYSCIFHFEKFGYSQKLNALGAQLPTGKLLQIEVGRSPIKKAIYEENRK